jgi:xanthine/uracil/vitamin C permease (AzgA family)
MLGCMLSDYVIMQLVAFLGICLIIRLVCFLFSELCALLYDHLAAYVVGGFLVISGFLFLVG